ncbi:MAG: nitrilase [Acidobacteriaceae bacterium]|nr:nitrilase [Acidobacteriaceae bacterium]
MTVIKAAAVQLSPVLYSREGTVDKVVKTIVDPGSKACSLRPFRKQWCRITPIFPFSSDPMRKSLDCLNRPAANAERHLVSRYCSARIDLLLSECES